MVQAHAQISLALNLRALARCPELSEAGGPGLSLRSSGPGIGLLE